MVTIVCLLLLLLLLLVTSCEVLTEVKAFAASSRLIGAGANIDFPSNLRQALQELVRLMLLSLLFPTTTWPLLTEVAVLDKTIVVSEKERKQMLYDELDLLLFVVFWRWCWC